MKTTRYQIQQGLPLIDHGKRPVDFRALVQKNKKGVWSVTSIVARIAGGSHFVSNLARGGSLSTVKEAVAKTSLSSFSQEQRLSSIEDSRTCDCIRCEQSIPAHFGELGIDLALILQAMSG